MDMQDGLVTRTNGVAPLLKITRDDINDEVKRRKKKKKKEAESARAAASGDAATDSVASVGSRVRFPLDTASSRLNARGDARRSASRASTNCAAPRSAATASIPPISSGINAGGRAGRPAPCWRSLPMTTVRLSIDDGCERVDLCQDSDGVSSDDEDAAEDEDAADNDDGDYLRGVKVVCGFKECVETSLEAPRGRYRAETSPATAKSPKNRYVEITHSTPRGIAPQPASLLENLDADSKSRAQGLSFAPPVGPVRRADHAA
ncbi:hypothetical protein THAOC_24478 [Thalassiosira oceanica]|uniref:Uncharacterized protein n=1 Tax=Thalassiosira oceanica TaxID=159749 RepID=K0RRX5_THAOC|nr:hypothetical protein THAOC_24478 [Thalassiosira oceanica]|eukprot:EJK55755.1 hypothetical protein THAOC_24478 [Thalassiosira oceanica]